LVFHLAGASAGNRNTVSVSSPPAASYHWFEYFHRSRLLLEAKEGVELKRRHSIRTNSRGLPLTAEAVSEINPEAGPHRRIPRH
jgi:hypothetical protein